MSALVRAMMIAAKMGQVKERQLNGLLDKKEANADQARTINETIDMLEQMRDGDAEYNADVASFTAREQDALTRKAAEGGVELTADGDFKDFKSAHEGY